MFAMMTPAMYGGGEDELMEMSQFGMFSRGINLLVTPNCSTSDE